MLQVYGLFLTVYQLSLTSRVFVQYDIQCHHYFSLVSAFRAIVPIHSGTYSHHHLFVFLTFKVVFPQPYHLESQSLAFMFIDTAHLTFTDLHLTSFSSPRHPMLITYSSLLFQILIFTTHDMVLRVCDTYFGHVCQAPYTQYSHVVHIGSLLWAHSFLYFRVVRPLLIFDIDIRVTFGDVLEGAQVLSVVSEAF